MACPRSLEAPPAWRYRAAEKIASRLRVNPEFAGKVYETMAPGTTLIITDQPVVRGRRNAAILQS